MIKTITRRELIAYANICMSHSYVLQKSWLTKPVKGAGRAHEFVLKTFLTELAKANGWEIPSQAEIDKVGEFIFNLRINKRMKKISI